MKRIGIDRPLHLQIAGEGKPNIRGPKERYFAKTTLPWMSIGYETQVPPLNILTFYNAIANNGTMVRPKFVKAAVKDGEVVHEFPTEVINPKICSDNTLTQIREILYKVVSEGLAKPAGSKQFAVAGKTGTAQISQGAAGYKAGRVNYLVSFCGYFPAEAPKYSCIVSIQKPGLPASGGLMAGSVFSKIAERVYAKNLRFDIRSAIDSTTNVIPAVKAGEMNEALRVLNTLDVPVQKQFETQKGENYGDTARLPRLPLSCKSEGFRRHSTQRSGHGGQRCRLFAGKQRAQSTPQRNRQSKKPVHCGWKPAGKRSDNSLDFTLTIEYTLYIIRYEIKRTIKSDATDTDYRQYGD